MFAKQGNSGNKVNIKRLTLYALLTAVCLIIGYLESLLSITLIAVAPGVKLGLSNAVVLTLICTNDTKGAYLVNVIRICLSALLFGSPISFVLSLSGGITATFIAHILSRSKSVSAIGISIASAVTHNVFQLVAAVFIVGFGVLYYLPVLILLGAVCGAFCGILAQLVLKHSKNFKV
ncbi:MAG: Gx transporter family protein [Clostridia bacterium]|nr:Gx transporter family protein [Clostridia bacterium]